MQYLIIITSTFTTSLLVLIMCESDYKENSPKSHTCVELFINLLILVFFFSDYDSV